MSNVIHMTKRFLIMSLMASAVFSCSKEDETAIEQEQNQEVSQTEVKTILDTDELSKAADDVVRDLFNNSESGKTAKTDECYQAEYSNTGFVVSFDNCSTKEGGEILNGSLTVVYGGDGDSYAYTVTYDDLMVGAIGIDGTRSFSFSGEQQNAITFDIVSDMTLTLADDSIISEKGNKKFAFVFGENSSAFTIDGEWTVKADGNTYSVAVTSLLEAQFGCEHIGKGIMDLSKNGLKVSVDFGNGDCDDVAVVKYPDGTKEDISLKD